MLPFFGRRKHKAHPASAPTSSRLEPQTFQPYCQVTNSISLSVRYDRPQSIRLWENTVGEQLLGHGYVIQSDGTLRPPDAYVPNYQLELRSDGTVVVPNALRTFTEYLYHPQPEELHGLMVWDHLLRSELVLVWFQARPDCAPQYEVVYWPPVVTVAQHAAALKIAQEIREHFPQLAALTSIPAASQLTPWRLHDGDRTAADFCRVHLPWLQQLAQLAHGQLDLDEAENRFVYHRDPNLPGLGVLFTECANGAPGLLETQLTTDLTWRLAMLEHTAPSSDSSPEV